MTERAEDDVIWQVRVGGKAVYQGGSESTARWLIDPGSQEHMPRTLYRGVIQWEAHSMPEQRAEDEVTEQGVRLPDDECPRCHRLWRHHAFMVDGSALCPSRSELADLDSSVQTSIGIALFWAKYDPKVRAYLRASLDELDEASQHAESSPDVPGQPSIELPADIGPERAR